MPGNCISVGLDESKNNEPYWAIYPNPSKDKLNIYVDEAIATISIYDMFGNLIIQHNKISSPLQLLNTGSLSGLYFIVIELQKGKIIQSKFISQ